MHDLIENVLLHQADWTNLNSPGMALRGSIVRNGIPEWIRERSEALAKRLRIDVTDLLVEGRDGTGRKTELPWVRVSSKSRSPHATEGWYIVYLFSALGDRVYLSLNQGTTIWTGQDFRRRPASELLPRVEWARRELRLLLGQRQGFLESISLDARRTDLGPAYEAGNVVALAYDIDHVPQEEVLGADLLNTAELLGALYEAYDRAGYVPGDLPPEVFDALTSADRAAGRPAGRRGGQGFGLTKPQQDAVEDHAIAIARQQLESAGWHVDYVGDKATWDLEVKRGDEKLFVEVKGTTSPGATVILTGAQVRKYQALHPLTAIIVVHDIALDRASDPPVVSGGEASTITPWVIDPDDLDAISWTYRTGL